jgi:hypothetical protein
MPPVILCGICRQNGRAEAATHYHTGGNGRTNVCQPCAEHIGRLAKQFPRTFPVLPKPLAAPVAAQPLTFA